MKDGDTRGINEKAGNKSGKYQWTAEYNGYENKQIDYFFENNGGWVGNVALKRISHFKQLWPNMINISDSAPCKDEYCLNTMYVKANLMAVHIAHNGYVGHIGQQTHVVQGIAGRKLLTSNSSKPAVIARINANASINLNNCSYVYNSSGPGPSNLFAIIKMN